MELKTLTVRTEVGVRFNEADPLGIVWHGHYVRYFEDGREAFGKKHGCGYLDFYRNGIVVPIVKLDCDYKKSLRYGDTVIIETAYLPTLAAKMNFSYNLYEAKTGDLVAKGSTMQVFLDLETNTLQLATPDFFQEWKRQNGFAGYTGQK
jgi:acyl-CoA thioester hydrolase